MENILFLLITISFFINFYMYFIFNVHIYQLNHYGTKSQINWIFKNKKRLLLRSISIVNIILFFLGDIGKIASIIIFLIAAYLNIQKETKIPIVYTTRVKRYIITSFIIIALIITILKLYFINNIVTLISFPIIILLTPFILIVADYINLPINKLIKNYYINDAKKILKNMPNLIVIGVTGSYGKTSTKNFLYKLLSAKYNVLITPENYNTTLGVVKTIRNNLKATHEIFVCEMGAYRVGEIKEICDIVRPKYGIITSIGPQHLESFGSIENIIKTKFELADSVPEDGIVFLNYDNEYMERNKINKKVVPYGIENETSNQYNAYDVTSTNRGLTFKMKDENNNEKIFRTSLLGKHNVENIVGSIAVANKLGIPMDTLISKVKLLESVPHRLQLINTPNCIIIDDAYNSNPSGSKSAIDTLGTFNGIKILVTPGMIELGEKQYECNYEFGAYAANVCDYIVLIGKEQTKPIYDGIISKDYNKDKIIIADTLQEGLNVVYQIKTDGKEKIILLENDLPDNY